MATACSLSDDWDGGVSAPCFDIAADKSGAELLRRLRRHNRALEQLRQALDGELGGNGEMVAETADMTQF